jgi:multidrug efflux system membrane fusion protein
MKRRASILLIGLLAVGIVSCGKKEEAVPEKVSTVTGVKVETVKASSVEDFYEAVGTVRSKTTSVLSPKIVGYILAVHVREGDRVKPGQLLVEIDNREASAQLKRAQAGVREAQEMLREAERTARAFESAKAAAEADQALAASTFKRYEPLLQRNSVSRQEFDEVQARFRAKTAEVNRAEEMLRSVQAKREQVLARIEQADAEVAQAKVMAGYGRVYAPLPGVVAAKQAEVGALASPGSPLLTIEDNTHYRLEANVEDGMLGKIHLGEPVQVNIQALGEGWTAGRVGEIRPSADPATRSSIVKIDLPENLGKRGPVRLLRSGLFGKGRFSIGKKQVIAIPQKAVFRQGELLQVFVVGPDNRARLRLIKTGMSYGDQVEVLSGLNLGERIIVEDTERVKDGDRVG